MTGRSLLLTELEHIAGSCCSLLALAKPEHYDWRPREGVRTLTELANHLAQIPAVDLLIMKCAKREEVVDAEQRLDRGNVDGWREVMQEGVADLSRFIECLSLDEFENNSGTAFYGRTQTFGQWLLEVITHMYHHRSQFYMYLKLNGYKVDTRTLYE